MAHKPVAPGDRVRKSAGEYNAFLRAADWVQTHVYDQPSGQQSGPRQSSDCVRVKNLTQSAREQFECVELGSLVILGSGGAVDGNLQIVFQGLKPGCDSSGSLRAWPDPRNSAVLLQPLYSSGSSGQVGWAAVDGVHPARVNVGETWHRRARPVKQSCVMVSGLFGPHEMLSPSSGSGVQTVICHLGHADNRGVIAKTTSSVAAATLTSGRLTLGTGTAKIHDPYTTLPQYSDSAHEFTVYNLDGEAVTNGSYVWVEPGDDWLPLVTPICVAPV